MSEPLVSICIPNYNNADYLEACITSALDQPYRNKEIVFVDDCSTDASLDVAGKYADRIAIHRNKVNIGQPKNTNRCVRRSRGRYLVILHSDDLLLPNFIATLAPLLEKHPNAGMAVGERVLTNADNERWPIAPFYKTNCVIPGLEQARVFMMTSFLPCQVLLRRRVFNAIGGVDERHIVNLDGLLWFKCALASDVAYVRDVVSAYRIHDRQTTARCNRTIAHMMEYYCTLTAMFAQAEHVRELHAFFPAAVRRVAELTVRYCRDVIRNQDYDLARRYLTLATVFDPSIAMQNEFKQLQEWLVAEPMGGGDRFSDLAVRKERCISYDPPNGAVIID